MQRSPILQICQDVADELSLSRPATLFPEAGTEADTDARKLLRALTKTVKYIAANYDWQVLRGEKNFVTVAQEWQPNTIPDDFLRFSLDGYFYNRTRRWKLSGPTSAAEWQRLKLYGIAAFPGYYSLASEHLRIYPEPPAGEEIHFTYIRDAIGTIGNASARWQEVGVPTQGTGQQPFYDIGERPHTSGTWTSIDMAPAPDTPVKRFTKDTDIPLWDDELLTLGTIANFRQMEGLEAQTAFQLFQSMLSNRRALDGGRRVLDMGKGPHNVTDRIQGMKNAASLVPIGGATGTGYSVP